MDAVSAIAPSAPQPSPWHSPVPYLFGGLAAMMGLIAFALMVLACSYWKLSGRFDTDETDIESGNRNIEGTTPPENHNNDEPSDMKEKFFVIMAGEANPTFLATPSSSRTASFSSTSWRSNSTMSTEKSSSSEVEMTEEVNQGIRADLVQGTNMENHEYADHLG